MLTQRVLRNSGLSVVLAASLLLLVVFSVGQPRWAFAQSAGMTNMQQASSTTPMTDTMPMSGTMPMGQGNMGQMMQMMGMMMQMMGQMQNMRDSGMGMMTGTTPMSGMMNQMMG